MPHDEQREGQLLVFRANIECPDCGSVFEGVWTDDSMDIEQIVDPPVGDQTCTNPECGSVFEAEFPGWIFYSEA